MDALDDVAALAEVAQRRLGVLRHRPLAGADLVGEAERLELAEAPDLERMKFVGLAVGPRREVDDAGAVAVAGELPIKIGPALGLDLAFERAADLVIGARPEFLRDQIPRPIAHAFLDVVAGDDEVLAVLAHAAHEQMDVGMVGVPVIDGDPIELGAEVLFHLPDEVAGEGLEVRHLHGVLGRDDEPEMMPVVLAALGERLRVGVIGAGSNSRPSLRPG